MTKKKDKGLRTDPRPERRLPPSQVVGTIISLRVPIWLETILRKEAHERGMRPGPYVRRILVELYGRKDLTRCRDKTENKHQRAQARKQAFLNQGQLPI